MFEALHLIGAGLALLALFLFARGMGGLFDLNDKMRAIRGSRLYRGE